MEKTLADRLAEAANKPVPDESLASAFDYSVSSRDVVLDRSTKANNSQRRKSAKSRSGAANTSVYLTTMLD